MKHLKLFFALFAMLALGVGNAWGAEELKETITPKDNGSDSSTAFTTATALSNGFVSNAAINAVTEVSKVYPGNGGWKFGASSAAGNISFTLKNPISNVTKIVITAKQYHATKKTTLNCNNIGAKTLTTSFADYEYEYTTPTEVSTISLVSAKASSGDYRCYVKEIKIYAEVSSGGTEEPVVSLTADPTTIDFGTVYQGTTVTDKTVAVSFENLTGNVTYSGLSTPFTATGTVSNDGDKITIAANTTTIGDYTQTLTITSAADSKTAEVTVKMNVVEKPAPTGTFTLHTGDLIEGDYVIYYSNKAMKAVVSSNRLGYEEVTPSGNEIVDPLAETIWHIAPSGDNWTIYNDNKGYAAGNGTASKAVLVADLTGDNAKKAAWTVTGTSTYDFVNVWNAEKNVNKTLRNNGTYGFACYATSTGGALSLYRKAGTKYNVNISATTNGTVTADPTSAEAGTTITLTVTPAGGYVLDALTVTDASSNPVTVTDNKFTMPASDVTVTATFKANEKPAATLTLSKNGVEETFPGSWKQDDVVTLPSITSDCVKEFVGWSANANCATEPEYAPGASYTLASTSQTLYAVYAIVEGGEATASVDMATYATANDWGSTSSTNQKQISINSDVTAVISAGGNSGKYYTDGVRIYQTEAATVTISTTVGELNSVKFTFTVDKTGTLEYNGTSLTSGTAVEVSGTSAIFSVGNSTSATNGQVRFTAIEVVYTGAVTYSNYSTTCAAAPKVEVNPTEVTATAAGGNGKVEVTSENVNTEDLRVALFNDEECGVVFTAGWLTASIDADKNITYTVAENTTYAERKAYIQLTAPDAAAATDPAVVVIPVTQAAKEKVFTSLAELLANITPTNTATKVTVTLTKEPIVDIYVSGTYRNGIFLNVPYQGTTKEIEIYSRDVPAEWVAGGSVSGTLTNCDWKVYNGTWELCPADWSELTYQEPKAVSTVVVSGAPTKTTYVDGEAFDPAGLTVTVNYNDATTEVNPTGVTFTVTPTTLVKGQTSVSVTATFNSVTSEAYTVNSLIVTDIQSMTILDFITSGGTRCYLEGIVSNITNTTYGNFDLTDASGTIYVYGCLNASGEKEKFAALGVKNGDKIKVIANESSLYNGRTQTKDVQYVSHKPAATIDVADIAMEVGETITISATVTPEGAPVTYTIKAGSDNCITLNDAEITATAAGTATIVATIAETADYMGATKEITVTVTAIDTRKKAVSPSTFTAVSGELNPNDITFASYQGGAGTAPGIYNNGIRLYQISSGKTYGGFITLTAVKGCMIDQVEITTTDQYNTTTVAYSVDGNETLLGSASVAKLSRYNTPVGLNTESVNILNIGSTSSNRLEIASITVYYTGQPLADPELSWTSNAVELRVGEAFTAPTLNNPYNVTGITYKSDNESLAKVNATTGAVTLVPDATGTATITATFEGNDTYKAAVVSYTINVKPALVYGVWELVTDVNSLAAGDKVVIVAKDDEFALSTSQGNNNRGQAAVTKNSDNTISFGNDVQVLTLEAGTKNNTFALNTGKGYLYAASSSNNYLRTETILSDNSSWDITISADGTATIVAQGTNTRKTMQYNQTSSVFACYASASQKALCLYMKKNVKVEGETDNTSIPNQSDVTVDDAELTVTTEAEYDNMYIGNNGSVDVKETVTVNNLYIQTTMGTTTSGQLNTTPENLIVNGDVFIDITLGKNGDSKQWHAFTVPFPVDAVNGVYDLNDNQLKNEVNYAIMDYHGDLRANGQYGWKKYRGILVPGTFYLMTVDGKRTTYRFKKVEDAAIVAPATKAITAFTGSGDPDKDKGWNGVGNPTLMYGKVAYDAQILDPQWYTYVPVPASSAHFTVGTPFFIQTAADATVTIAAEVSGSLAPARRAAAAVDKVKVMLGNADYTDHLYVSASEDATTEYEIGKDLVKMVMTNTPIVPQIFAEAYGARLCMVNAPMTCNEATVALNLYAPAEGEYTLSVEEQADATVYLLYNGNIVWNLSMSEYPIQLSQGDNAGYSLVVRRENAPTDVENILGADEQTEKFIYNGKLYILHEGKVFDAVGNVLK